MDTENSISLTDVTSVYNGEKGDQILSVEVATGVTDSNSRKDKAIVYICLKGTESKYVIDRSSNITGRTIYTDDDGNLFTLYEVKSNYGFKETLDKLSDEEKVKKYVESLLTFQQLYGTVITVESQRK